MNTNLPAPVAVPLPQDEFSARLLSKRATGELSSECERPRRSTNVPEPVPLAFAFCSIVGGLFVIGGVNATSPANSQLPLKVLGPRLPPPPPLLRASTVAVAG